VGLDLRGYFGEVGLAVESVVSVGSRSDDEMDRERGTHAYDEVLHIVFYNLGIVGGDFAI
jgi:hypothetical protein